MCDMLGLGSILSRSLPEIEPSGTTDPSFTAGQSDDAFIKLPPTDPVEASFLSAYVPIQLQPVFHKAFLLTQRYGVPLPCLGISLSDQSELPGLCGGSARQFDTDILRKQCSGDKSWQRE